MKFNLTTFKVKNNIILNSSGLERRRCNWNKRWSDAPRCIIGIPNGVLFKPLFRLALRLNKTPISVLFFHLIQPPKSDHHLKNLQEADPTTHKGNQKRKREEKRRTTHQVLSVIGLWSKEFNLKNWRGIWSKAKSRRIEVERKQKGVKKRWLNSVRVESLVWKKD